MEEWCGREGCGDGWSEWVGEVGVVLTRNSKVMGKIVCVCVWGGGIHVKIHVNGAVRDAWM